MDIQLNNLQRSASPQNSGTSQVRRASSDVGSLATEGVSYSVTKKAYLQKLDNWVQTQG